MPILAHVSLQHHLAGEIEVHGSLRIGKFGRSRQHRSRMRPRGSLPPGHGAFTGALGHTRQNGERTGHIGPVARARRTSSRPWLGLRPLPAGREAGRSVGSVGAIFRVTSRGLHQGAISRRSTEVNSFGRAVTVLALFSNSSFETMAPKGSTSRAIANP